MVAAGGGAPRGRFGAALVVGAMGFVVAASLAADDEVPRVREPYQVTSWSVADGLPQGTVTDIAETADGQLWVATFGGLARFDGVRFDVFDLATLPELPAIRITALAPDPAGGLWMATQSGHVAYLRNRRVERAIAPPDQRTELVAIERLPDGEVFVRSNMGEIFRVGASKLERIATGGPLAGIHDLAAMPDGSLWAGWGREARELQGDGRRRATPGEVQRVVREEGGGLWITFADGVARLRGDVVERLVIEPPLGGLTRALASAAEGRLWLGTDAGPVEVARQPDGIWRRSGWRPPPALEVSIRSLHLDRAGNLWAGTNGSGLFRIARSPFTTLSLGEGRNLVSSIAADLHGGAWVSMGCHGVFHAAAGAAFVRAPSPPGEGEPSSCEMSLATAPDGDVWLRARRRLYRIGLAGDGSPRPPRKFPVELPDEGGLLVASKDGGLWIVSEHGGVDRLSPEGALARVADLGVETQGAAVDGIGALWVGGWGEVVRIDGRTIERFGREQGMPPGQVRAILPLADGAGASILFGTYGGGVGELRNGRARAVSAERGLLDDSISALIEDGRRRLWIVSNRGVSMLRTDELEEALADGRRWLEPVDFGAERGVAEGNFGSPAAALDAGGRLWFGTIDGLTTIDAAAFPPPTLPPRVVIETIALDGVRRDAADLVEIPPGTGRVRVDFTTLPGEAPTRVRFRQKFVPVDRDWVELRDRRYASFTPGSPGDYRLEVEARDENGVWSTEPARLSMRVLPAWWQTAWFRVALALALLGAAFALHRLRTRTVVRRHRALLAESEERRRAEEDAARLRQELEHLSRVATAGELASSLAHEVNQPLAAILFDAQAGRSYLSRGEAGRAEVDEILEDIRRQGQRAAEIVQRLRDFLSKKAPSYAPLDLAEVVGTTLPLLRRDLQESGIRVELATGAGLPRVSGDRVQLQQVVVNLIQNASDALRDSPPPRRLSIRLDVVDGGVALTVADSGPGVDPAVAGRVFEPFVTTKESGMGVGLSICRSLVAGHGGSLTLQSPEGRGARFVVWLPAAARAEQSA